MLLLLLFAVVLSLSGKTHAACPSREVSCPGSPDRCVLGSELCNGFPDCPDSSDETMELCMNRPCSTLFGLEGLFLGLGEEDGSSETFRCSYGGCISSLFRCDGIKNCIDGSDETAKECGKDRCGSRFYPCDYGACIPRRQACDGRKNCWDGSDETQSTCRRRRKVCTPRRQIKCDYGACYDKRKKCDGKADCIDGSDEKESLCGAINPVQLPPPQPPVQPPPQEPPVQQPPVQQPPVQQPPVQQPPVQQPPAPQPPASQPPTEPPPVPQPPASVPAVLFPVGVDGNSSFGCSPPNCLCPFAGQEHICLPCDEIRDVNNTCRSLGKPDVCSMVAGSDVTVDVLTCGSQQYMLFASFQRDSQSCVSASKKVPTLTVVLANCWGTADLLMRCHSDGYWRPNGSPATAESASRSYAEQQAMKRLCQPQHVNSQVCGRRPRFQDDSGGSSALFYAQRNSWPWVAGLKRHQRYECSATVITAQHLLTAAHCVTRSAESWNETMDVRDLRVQISQNNDRYVSSIILQPEYRAVVRPTNDIALVKLEAPLTFSKNFYPACVDLDGFGFFSNSFAVTFNRKNGAGRYQYEELVQQLDPACHSPHDRCYQLGISSTQFCGVDVEGNKFLSGGSSGGPFLQDLGFEGTEEWAVSGVVSSHVKQNSCSLPHTLFTSVSSFKQWILNSVHTS